jgi:tripartite-type tricarboxylate transporter receptor subunit TctC
MAIEALKHVAGVDMIFVPYPGNAQAVTALLGHNVDVAVTGYPVVAGLVNSGKLRALATTTPARIEPLPDLYWRCHLNPRHPGAAPAPVELS